jgi:mannosyl-oligosaccharide alpha-1,2-mannosidase
VRLTRPTGCLRHTIIGDRKKLHDPILHKTNWSRRAFASQPHRASNRIVLAEIGSLSVEFTRLAQLTGEHKYYDAIARITDALEEFQNKTRLPGMWPTYLDASGCKEIEYKSEVQLPLGEPLKKEEPAKAPETSVAEEFSPLGNKYVPLDLPSAVEFSAPTSPVQSSPAQSSTAPLVAGEVGKGKIQNWEDKEISPLGNKYVPLDLPSAVVFSAGASPAQSSPAYWEEKVPFAAAVSSESSPAALVPGEVGKMKIKGWDDKTPVGDLAKDSALKRRQLDDDDSLNSTPATPVAENSATPASATPVLPTCIERGFVSSSDQGSEEYTLGGMSDSTYEYLPKQWLLLGGQVEKYQAMYESAMDVVKQNLLFRPMLPKDDDILFSGKLNVAPTKPDIGNGELEAENAHLTCFSGGMFGMGAKIFDRPEDLEIAKKLTEGCVYSYDMTATGIMPEAFYAIPCESMKSCEWNQTKYYKLLDPQAESRLTSYESQMETYKQQIAAASALFEAEMASFTAPPLPPATPLAPVQVQASPESTLQKRQLGDAPPTIPKPNIPTVPEPHVPQRQAPERNLMVEGEMEEAEGPPTPVQIGLSAAPSRTAPTFPVIYSPKPPLSHKEYVKNRIQEERLPPGVVRVNARNYILRYVSSTFSPPPPHIPSVHVH